MSNLQPSSVFYVAQLNSRMTQCVAPNVPVVINIKFQMHVKWLLMYCCFIFEVNEVEMCSNEIHIFVACGKIEEHKIHLKLKLGISKDW
jgi:hypothetical protein